MLHREPVPGIPILEPDEIPYSNAKLIGYQVIEPADKFFVKPKPGKINTLGWVSIVVCAIIFFPVTCVPCCLGYSYSKYQIPVYEAVRDSVETSVKVGTTPTIVETHAENV